MCSVQYSTETNSHSPLDEHGANCQLMASVQSATKKKHSSF